MFKKTFLAATLITLTTTAFAQSHSASFSSEVVFTECKESMFGETNQQCDCPKGNNYLECLVSAKVIINADPKDIGNRGYAYVAVMQGDSYSVLNQSGQWIPAQQFKRGSYTSLFDPLRRTNVIGIPVPDVMTLAQICPKGARANTIRSGQTGAVFTVVAGYGAVSQAEMEMGTKSQTLAAELGQKFDMEMFTWSRARVNTSRNKKSGEVAQLACRPVDIGGN
jgi:hypothetical protein